MPGEGLTWKPSAANTPSIWGNECLSQKEDLDDVPQHQLPCTGCCFRCWDTAGSIAGKNLCFLLCFKWSTRGRHHCAGKIEQRLEGTEETRYVDIWGRVLQAEAIASAKPGLKRECPRVFRNMRKPEWEKGGVTIVEVREIGSEGRRQIVISSEGHCKGFWLLLWVKMESHWRVWSRGETWHIFKGLLWLCVEGGARMKTCRPVRRLLQLSMPRIMMSCGQGQVTVRVVRSGWILDITWKVELKIHLLTDWMWVLERGEREDKDDF